MKVVAVDPGNVQSAYIVLERGYKFDDPIDILEFDILQNEELRDKLRYMYSCMMKSGDAEMYDDLIIEMIACYGMAVGKSVFETCLWIGRFMEQWNDEDVHLVYRRDIKMNLCNSVRAKDANIRRVLLDMYGEPGTKKNPGPTYGIKKDIWAALAVGTYWLTKQEYGS